MVCLHTSWLEWLPPKSSQALVKFYTLHSKQIHTHQFVLTLWLYFTELSKTKHCISRPKALSHDLFCLTNMTFRCWLSVSSLSSEFNLRTSLLVVLIQSHFFSVYAQRGHKASGYIWTFHSFNSHGSATSAICIAQNCFIQFCGHLLSSIDFSQMLPLNGKKGWWQPAIPHEYGIKIDL